MQPNRDGKSIADLYNLNSKDIYLNLDGVQPSDDSFNFTSEGKIIILDSTITSLEEALLTSSIRIKDGKAEVLLIASKGGKFDTNGEELTYALSSWNKCL